MNITPLFVALSIVAPADRSVVPTHTPLQKSYLNLPRETRIEKFATDAYRQEMARGKWYPQPLEIAWSGAEGAVTLEVTRLQDGALFFKTNFIASAYKLDNFEIARTYRVRLTDASGATAESTFTTEDEAPRFLRVEGVPNVRDLGGRKGRDGRRVRQGRVIRSAGLNDNAGEEEIPDAELGGADPDGSKRAWAKALVDYRSSLRKYRDTDTGIEFVPVRLQAEYTDEQTCTIKLTAERAGAVYLEAIANHGWRMTKNGTPVRHDAGGSRSTVLMIVDAGETTLEVKSCNPHNDFIYRLRSLEAKQDDLRKLVASEMSELNGQHHRARRGLMRPVAGRTRIGDWNKSYWLDTLGIKSDIDLRSDGECACMTGSPLGETVKWFHYSSGAYGQMKDQWAREAFTKVFRVFLDAKNYPIDFHCIAGQDRTGAVAFILNALLGVEEEELYRDWESTGFWNPAGWFKHEGVFNRLVEVFNQYEGKTINERVERYVLSLGFTQKDLETFRELMLEDK